MQKSSSDPSLSIFKDATGGTSGQVVDPMLAQLIAMMEQDQTSKDTKTGDIPAKGSKTAAFLESSAKQSQPKLLTRSGSDPQFDNVAYLKKVETQTLEMLRAQGIDVNEETLREH